MNFSHTVSSNTYKQSRSFINDIITNVNKSYEIMRRWHEIITQIMMIPRYDSRRLNKFSPKIAQEENKNNFNTWSCSWSWATILRTTTRRVITRVHVSPMDLVQGDFGDLIGTKDSCKHNSLHYDKVQGEKSESNIKRWVFRSREDLNNYPIRR